MTGTPSPALEASGACSTSSKVFRSELDPVDFLRRSGYMYPDKVALVHGERRYSYGELGDRSWRLANGLRLAGLERRHRVATLLPNSPAMLEAHFGVPAADGILVPINTRLGTGSARRSSPSIAGSGSTAMTSAPNETSEAVSLPVPAPRSRWRSEVGVVSVRDTGSRRGRCCARCSSAGMRRGDNERATRAELPAGLSAEGG
jgi:long-subunit acyl-CoA synthetase (AMP-forming)